MSNNNSNNNQDVDQFNTYLDSINTSYAETAISAYTQYTSSYLNEAPITLSPNYAVSVPADSISPDYSILSSNINTVSWNHNSTNMFTGRQLNDWLDTVTLVDNTIPLGSQKIQEEKNSYILIKNRSYVFQTFIRSIPKDKKSLFKSDKENTSEDHTESKKRIRYWSASLFNEVELYISRMLIFSGKTTGQSEDKELKWISVKGEHTIIPVGLDIWSTRGGVLQDNLNGIQWDKTFLIFLPSKSLLKKINDMSIDICFTNVSEIKIPTTKTCKDKIEPSKRNIFID
jgi:hypothetical protein